MWLPSISCGMCCGERLAAAINFVTRSSTTMSTKLPQKRGGLGLALSIFFALLALDAISGVRQCVEALEADLATAVVTFAELLGIAIKPSERFVNVPEETAFLAREEKRLFSLHRVGALVRHMERVRAQIAVRPLWSRSESLVVVTQLLEHTLTLFEQALLKVQEALFRHCLRFFAASCCCHL